MAAKKIIMICASALFFKSVFSQCLAGRAGIAPGLVQGFGPGIAPGIGQNPGLSSPYGCGASSSGGGFITNSFSPLPPTGLSVLSENSIEGKLTVGGQVPFLGTVALEGILPTAGSGAISYGCGNGGVGITSEGGPISTGIHNPGTYGPGVGSGLAGYGPGFPQGLGYNGLGCGGF